MPKQGIGNHELRVEIAALKRQISDLQAAMTSQMELLRQELVKLTAAPGTFPP